MSYSEATAEGIGSSSNSKLWRIQKQSQGLLASKHCSYRHTASKSTTSTFYPGFNPAGSVLCTVPHTHQISAVSPSWDIGNAVLALMLAWRHNTQESITNRPLGCDSQQFDPGIVLAFVLSSYVSTFVMSDTGFKHLTQTSPTNHTF